MIFYYIVLYYSMYCIVLYYSILYYIIYYIRSYHGILYHIRLCIILYSNIVWHAWGVHLHDTMQALHCITRSEHNMSMPGTWLAPDDHKRPQQTQALI